MGSVEDAVELLLRFKGDNLKHRIAGLEGGARSLDASASAVLNDKEGIDSDLLQALRRVKLASSQIDVAIHAAGILAALPHLLEPGEVIESLSLGAGNTGREFDVETSRRVVTASAEQMPSICVAIGLLSHKGSMTTRFSSSPKSGAFSVSGVAVAVIGSP